jgi:hypothetical protein
MGDDAPEMKGLFTFRQSLHPNRRHLRERTAKTLHMASGQGCPRQTQAARTEIEPSAWVDAKTKEAAIGKLFLKMM